MTDTTTSSTPATKRPRKMAREAKPEIAAGNAAMEAELIASAAPSSAAAKPPSKAALVLDMLARPCGATIDQIVAATGWLPHTTRAVLTGFKKKGHVLVSEKPAEGARVYHMTGKLETA